MRLLFLITFVITIFVNNAFSGNVLDLLQSKPKISVDGAIGKSIEK